MQTPTLPVWMKALEALWMVENGLESDLVQKTLGWATGTLTSQLQAISGRAKPLNIHPKFLRVVLHTIFRGIRGYPNFFGQFDPPYY